MASREESVDVSIAAALLKIGQLEKALAKAMRATVTLNTTAAMNKVKTLDNALTKATSRRSLTFDTARAQAQIRALDREMSRIGTGRVAGGVDLTSTTEKQAAAARAAAAKTAAAQEAASRRATVAAEKSAAAQIRAEEEKGRRIAAINQNLAARTAAQQAAADRTAARSASQGIAQQRATLSAQLSQVRSLQNVGQQLTFGLTLPIAAAGVAVARLGFNFEDTINRIRILTTPAFRTSKAAVDDLRTAILRLGPETGRTPTELAEGFYQIASAGVSGAVALDVLKAAAQAATIGLGDTNVVANIATSVLNAYGTSAGNAFQITNVLAQAVRLAKGEASEFAPVLGRLLPVAKNLGISFSDVAGSVALLTRNGLSASEATTQLRGLFNSFIKPSVQARKELDRVGLSSSSLLQQLQAGDFIGAIGKIKAAFGGDQLGLGRLFRNQQGLNAFLTLTRDLPATAAALRDVAAAGEDVDKSISGFDQIKADPVVQFKIALSALQAELIKIGTSIGPTVVTIARLAGSFLSLFNSLPSGVKTFAALAITAAALAGPFLLVFTATQRLSIAKQQLAIAQGQVAGASNAEATALGRLGTALTGGASGVVRFAGALGALAAIAGGLQLGQQLASAASEGQKFTSIIGIAGTAVGAFIAGSVAGGPVLGGIAAGATVAASAIGFFGEQTKRHKKSVDDFRDSLIGAKDAEDELGRVTTGIIPQLREFLDGTDKFGQIEFGQLEKAGVNFADFAKAVTIGGRALEQFLKAASGKVAAQQLKELNAEIAKVNPQTISAFGDEARNALEKLDAKGLVTFDKELNVIAINGPKAFGVLRAAAEKDLAGLATALGIPIEDARRLTELLKGTEDGLAGLTTAAEEGDPALQGFGSAADGAAISISDLAAALDTAVTNADALNQSKLDAFTGQADQAAALAGLFETIDKNKDVLPHLGENFDLTTQSGRDMAKAAAEVQDALAGQVGEAQKRATALIDEGKGVDAAKDSYSNFLSQLAPVATAAGLTGDQFNLVLAGMGGDFATFADGLVTSGIVAAAASKAAIDGLLGAIPKEAADAVRAIKEPSDQVAALANQLSLLPPTTVANVIASVANADNVGALAEVVQNLDPETQVAVLAQTLGLPGVEALNQQILDAVSDEHIAKLVAEVAGTPQAEALNAEIAKLPPTRQTHIAAIVNGTDKVKDLKTTLDGTKGKEVFVTAHTSGQGSVENLASAINKVQSKNVVITATTRNLGAGSGAPGTGLAIIGHRADGTPIFGRSGMLYGRGGIRKMAAGGVITGMSRQSMIVRQRAAQGILWGEPETMGEAYISYAQRFRGRNRRILSRVARDFGMMVVPMTSRAAGGMTVASRSSAGMSDAQFAMLTRAVQTRQSGGRDAPVIGNVTLETRAQTPAAVAVETVGAIGARLQERLADRF